MLVFDKNKIVYFSEKENSYFDKVLKFKDLWESNCQEFSIKTSGSTGTPKEIILTRKQLIASAELTGKTFGLVEGDTALCCLNVEYIAGMMMLVRGFVLGLKMIVIEPSASIINAQLSVIINLGHKKIDFFAFVPLQIQTILENISPNQVPNDSKIHQLKNTLNNAKAIIIGGAAVGESLLEKIQYLQAPIFATYGMTETVTHIAIRRLNGLQKSIFFVALEGVEIAKDERNCLIIKSKITDYQEVITNDIVAIIDEKHFELLGRYDNIINSGGLKIQLEKVEKSIEEILEKIQFTSRFFAFGIPDEKLGQKLVLVIEGNSSEKLKIEDFKEKLPKFECPKEICFVHKFIETPTGKIDKIKTINEFIATN